MPDDPAKLANGVTPLNIDAADVARVLATARAMLRSGKSDEGRALLRQLIQRVPGYEEPWLQLLALDPTPAEEVELLEAFLQHYPNHRFAQAFRTRLRDMQIVLMLSERQDSSRPDSAGPSKQRLGDYLIARNFVTLEQVERALEAQQEMRKLGIERRLGTIMLMNGHLTENQLALALAETHVTGFGEFGNYLMRSGALTSSQVGQALARQAALAAQSDRQYLESRRSSVARLLG